MQAAIGHWAPRFVANGVPLTDFQEVTAGIRRWEEWCAAWCARAAVHEALARQALATGFHLSAGEHLKACISLSGPFDWQRVWDALPGLTKEAFRVRAKCATEEDARVHGRQLSLVDAARNITCPLFIVTGKLDRIVPWEDAERLASEASGPVVKLILEDGNHVANNRAYKYRPQSADWMAQLAACRMLSPTGC